MKTGNECIYSKTRFATKKDADSYINKLAEVSTRTTIPKRAYLCSCGSWHLTSNPDSYETLRIKKLEEDLKRLKEENVLLASDRNKEDRITLKADLRVKDANTRVLALEKSEALLKKDIRHLIIKNMSLENKINDLTALKTSLYFLDSNNYSGLKNSHLPQ